MKKILALLLALALTMGCMLALASCGKNNEEDDDTPDAPSQNAEKTLENLENAGYEVETLTAAEFRDEFFNVYIEGVDQIIFAFDKTNNGIYIIYFESEEALKAAENSVKEVFDILKGEAVEEGFELVEGKSGYVTWLGTEDAINASAGKSTPTNPGPGSGTVNPTPNPGPGSGTAGEGVPEDNPEATVERFIRCGFMAEYTEDSSFIATTGVSGIVGVLEAEHEDVEEAIFIFYFESANALKDATEKIDAFINKLAASGEDAGFVLIKGKSGRMAWVGTERAIKIAAGATIIIEGGDSNDKVDGGDSNNKVDSGNTNNPDNDPDSGSVSNPDSGSVPNPDSGDVNAPKVIPMDNYFELYTYLGDLGYTVHRECVDYGVDFSSYGMPGIQAYLLAMNPDSNETIEIYYFDNAENADKSYEKINGFFEDFMEKTKEDGKEFIYVIEKYENMIWIGTESTIRVAAGK